MATIEQKTTEGAYRKGAEARKKGQKKSDNPYPKRVEKELSFVERYRAAWNEGWEEALLGD
jgi:hypothetical protein